MHAHRRWLFGAALAAAVALAGCGGSPATPSGHGAAGGTGSGTSPTTAPDPFAPIHAVAWGNVSVPGAVCQAATPIRLTAGSATIPAPPAVHAGTATVSVTEREVIYGNMASQGPVVAALNIWCTTPGGTADGQLQDTWVIEDLAGGQPHLIGTISPQQASTGGHVAYFDGSTGGITFGPGNITVKELWYGPSDATCCPSGHATTVWTYANGALTPGATQAG